MALNTKLAHITSNAEANALAALLNTGYIRIYDGSQPANPDTAVSSQNLLAELRFGSTAFGTAVNGVITANAITDATSAAATGTAAWYRMLKSDGTSAVMDGTVGTAGCNLNMNSVAIQSGATVSITSFTHTVTE